MKPKFIQAYMKAAYVFAELSHCNRRQVGCVIVKHNRIISIGYNGTPSGWDTNCCEDSEGNTKPEVLHAEANGLMKLAACHESGEGASLFVTCAPCMDCAKLIVQSKISTVYYCETYRSRHGLDFLQKCGVSVEQVTLK